MLQFPKFVLHFLRKKTKILMMCDCSRYNHRFVIYTGKTSTGSEKSLAFRVVLSICHDFSGNSHVLFVDNVFNGYELLLTLKNNNIF